MITETIELCAYHESGRVAYAYQCGYICESMELSEVDSGAGVSRLNAGADGEFVQILLAGKSNAFDTARIEKAIDIARKLMKIYCAGSCAEIFFKENKQISDETEIEIPGQDMKYINIIQTFLKNNIPNHPSDYPSQIIIQLFRELKQEDNWSVIETLAQTILKKEDKKISRFYIEDALMKAGFKPGKKQQGGLHSFDMKVKEDDTKKERPAPTKPITGVTEENALDEALKSFLRLIQHPLNEEEIEASVKFLKSVFKSPANE